MTITSSGSLGTNGAGAVNGSSITVTTTGTLNAGDFALFVVSKLNSSTADGNNNEVTSASGGTGNWTKLGEYTNSAGAANAGVTVAVFLFEASATNTNPSFVANFASSIADRAATVWGFTKGAGLGIRACLDMTTNPVNTLQDGGNGFGSSTLLSANSNARLYFNAAGKKANSATALTPTTNFTAITGVRSRNAASAVVAGGEFRINTSTGETSNPTLAVAGDTVAIFVALEEVTTTATGTISAAASLSGTGSALAAATGSVSAAAALAGSGGAIASATGTIAASAALSGAGASLAASTGSVVAAASLLGVGSSRAAATGSIAAVAALVGVGGALGGGSTGTIAATATLTGVGSSIASATGTISATASLSGAGGKLVAATGTIAAVAVLSGAGSSRASATGAIAATATLTGVASSLFRSTGSIIAMAALNGVGSAISGNAIPNRLPVAGYYGRPAATGAFGRPVVSGHYGRSPVTGQWSAAQ